MGEYSKNVQVGGEPGEVFRILVGVLTNNQYTIGSQNPPTQVTAARGSKAVAIAIGIADYEELNVTLHAIGPGEYDVQFLFKFPYWDFTLIHKITEKGKYQNCDLLVKEFARLAADSRIPAAGGAPAAGEKPCPRCRRLNVENAAFCASCGEKFLPLPQLARKPLVCAACSAEITATAKFCPACGTKTGSQAPPSPITCATCSSKIPPGTKFCLACGAKQG